MTPLYLDNAATTVVDPRVAERLIPFLRVDLGREGVGVSPLRGSIRKTRRASCPARR